MKALYSNAPCSEAEITGTALEWSAFARAVLQNGSVITCEAVTDASPYQKSARTIRISHIRGAKVVVLSSASGDLIIQGDPDLFDTFSQGASAFGKDLSQGSHIHIDYLGEDHYVGKDTMSTVFMHAEG